MAERPRRNLWVGISTVYTVLGERVAPSLVSRYLARTGVDGQQTDEDLPRWGSNLFRPRDEEADRGAHGPFDDSATARDPVLWLSGHRKRLTAGAAAVGAAAVAGALLHRTSR